MTHPFYDPSLSTTYPSLCPMPYMNHPYIRPPLRPIPLYYPSSLSATSDSPRLSTSICLTPPSLRHLPSSLSTTSPSPYISLYSTHTSLPPILPLYDPYPRFYTSLCSIPHSPRLSTSICSTPISLPHLPSSLSTTSPSPYISLYSTPTSLSPMLPLYDPYFSSTLYLSMLHSYLSIRYTILPLYDTSFSLYIYVSLSSTPTSLSPMLPLYDISLSSVLHLAMLHSYFSSSLRPLPRLYIPSASLALPYLHPSPRDTSTTLYSIVTMINVCHVLCLPVTDAINGI